MNMDDKKLQKANEKFKKLQKVKKKSKEGDTSDAKPEGIPDKDFKKFLGCGG